MKAKVTTILLLSIFAIIVLTSACQENSTGNNKRARLVGNQNLELRKQLAAEIKKHAAEIKQYQADLADCEARVEEQILASEKLGDSTLKIFKDFADKSKNNDELILENQRLKEKIKELELKLGNSQ